MLETSSPIEEDRVISKSLQAGETFAILLTSAFTTGRLTLLAVPVVILISARWTFLVAFIVIEVWVITEFTT